MIKSESNRFGKTIFILYPGDYIAVKEDCILSSVTGTTVLVCLFDTKKKIGGMGHFIVPGSIGTDGIFMDDIARHGIQSMELLIGEIVKKGGDRKFLKAKLFGAGYLTESIPHMGGLAESNIRFLQEYFTLEKIQVVDKDREDISEEKFIFCRLAARFSEDTREETKTLLSSESWKRNI